MFLQNFNNNNGYGCCESLPPYHTTNIVNSNISNFGNFSFLQQQQFEQQHNVSHFHQPQLFSNQLISSYPLLSASSSTATLTTLPPAFTQTAAAGGDSSANCDDNLNENLNHASRLTVANETDNENDNENEENRENSLALDDNSVENDAHENDYGITYQSTKFRYDQAECLCKALENSNNIHKLADFLSNVPASPSDIGAEYSQQAGSETSGESVSAQFSGHQQILRAKAIVLFSERKFDEFYEIITSNYFHSEHHPLLQKLWNEAHYAEAEMLRGKTLDPVSRYRVRKKNAYPSTIWDGEGTSYCFKKSARAVLRDAYQRHNTPNHHQKQELARLTKLSVVQVSNWFKNQRQRARQYEREGRGLASSGSAYGGYSSGDCEGSEREDENDNDNENLDENESANCAQLSPIPAVKRRKIVKDARHDENVGGATSDAANAAAADHCAPNENCALEAASHNSATANDADNIEIFAPQSTAPFYAFASANDDYDAMGGDFSTASRAAAAMQICAMAQMCNGTQGGGTFSSLGDPPVGSAHFRSSYPPMIAAGAPYPSAGYDNEQLKNESYFPQIRVFAPIQMSANCQLSSQPMASLQIGNSQLAVPKYETL